VTSWTPPAIKWLLVERATLVGDISRMEQRKALLDAELIRARSLVAAVDTTIRLMERDVRVDAAGTVQRHCPSYRRRGALQDFLIATLQDAGDAGISTRDATLLISAHFELDFVSKAEFRKYSRNTVSAQFRRFRNQGPAENMPSTGQVAGYGGGRLPCPRSRSWRRSPVPRLRWVRMMATKRRSDIVR